MNNRIYKSAGFSLIEIMVSLVLGLFVLAMIVNIFINTRQNHVQNARVTETLESGRYALNKLASDLKSTGFLGGVVDPSTLSVDASLAAPTVDCGAAEPSWAYDVTTYRSMQFLYNATGASASAQHECIQAADFQDGTDVFSIKRVYTQDVSAGARIAGNIYLRSDFNTACLYYWNGTDEPGGAGCPTVGYSDWQYLSHVYYIRNYAVTAGDDIPTLCRKTLTVNGTPTMDELCLAEGVEHFHIQFGIDTDSPRDGVANQFLSNPTPAQLRTRAVAAKIFVLARAKQEDQTFTNQKTYTMGSRVVGPVDDKYYRRMYSTTVLLRNPMYTSMFNDI